MLNSLKGYAFQWFVIIKKLLELLGDEEIKETDLLYLEKFEDYALFIDGQLDVYEVKFRHEAVDIDEKINDDKKIKKNIYNYFKTYKTQPGLRSLNYTIYGTCAKQNVTFEWNDLEKRRLFYEKIRDGSISTDKQKWRETFQINQTDFTRLDNLVNCNYIQRTDDFVDNIYKDRKTDFLKLTNILLDVKDTSSLESIRKLYKMPTGTIDEKQTERRLMLRLFLRNEEYIDINDVIRNIIIDPSLIENEETLKKLLRRIWLCLDKMNDAKAKKQLRLYVRCAFVKISGQTTSQITAVSNSIIQLLSKRKRNENAEVKNLYRFMFPERN
jgi:hypothetical protein